jgi:hypothetical protein
MDYKDLGFETQEEMDADTEARFLAEYYVWRQLQKFKIKD